MICNMIFIYKNIQPKVYIITIYIAFIISSLRLNSLNNKNFSTKTYLIYKNII